MTPSSASARSAPSAQNAGNADGAPSAPSHGPAPAEAMFLRVFLLMRAYHVVSGLLTLLFDRRRFVRSGRAWLVFAGLVAESGWVARRAHRRGDYSHPPTAAVDVGCVAIGVALCSSALPPEEQFNASNWMFPVGLLSGVGAAAAMTRRRDGMLAGAVLVGSYVMATGARSKRANAAMLLGVAQFVNTYAISDILTGRVRRTTTEIDRLRALAVSAADERGRNEERSRSHRELHVGAVKALDALRAHIADGRVDDAHTVARKEAARLRRALRGEPISSLAAIRGRIEAVVDGFAESGISVELLDDGEDPTVESGVADTLCDLLGALLGQAASGKPFATDATVGPRLRGKVVVAMTVEDGVLELSVVDGSDHPDGTLDDSDRVRAWRSSGGELTRRTIAAGSMATIRIGVEPT